MWMCFPLALAFPLVRFFCIASCFFWFFFSDWISCGVSFPFLFFLDLPLSLQAGLLKRDGGRERETFYGICTYQLAVGESEKQCVTCQLTASTSEVCSVVPSRYPTRSTRSPTNIRLGIYSGWDVAMELDAAPHPSSLCA